MPNHSLARHLHTDPAYAAVVKLVGYKGVPLPMSKEQADELDAKYGREKIVQVSGELLDFDVDGRVATLKAEVRTLCLGLLGPSPAEWDEFYQGVVNPPQNPYQKALPKKSKPKEKVEEIDLVAAAVADAIQQETGMTVETKVPNEVEELRAVHGRQLRLLLKGECDRFQRHTPTEFEHKEAVRRMDLIESEMKRRGNKVPERPAYREPYNPGERDPKTTIVVPGGLGDATKLSDKRLGEMIEMNLRELENTEADTICHHDALRDIKLLEAEKRRRTKEGWDGAA
jgi:hypothetical protein